MSRRAFVIVLDACGVGALPDAAAYRDAGANTLGHLADAVGGLRLPTLEALGLGCIAALAGVPPAPGPALHGRLHPLGAGKDSATGHWELMGASVPGGLRAEDLLILTADHGCDPTTPGTDHTREYAPLLARFAGDDGRRHDGPLADVGASVLRWLTGRDAPGLPGSSFVP